MDQIVLYSDNSGHAPRGCFEGLKDQFRFVESNAQNSLSKLRVLHVTSGKLSEKEIRLLPATTRQIFTFFLMVFIFFTTFETFPQVPATLHQDIIARPR